MKALILEDNPSLARSLKSLLEGQGWQVSTSSTWGKLATSFKEQNFELIVLDILLKDIKGFDILPLLAKQAPTAKIALISGLMAQDQVEKHIPPKLKKNCRFYKKPINEKDFLEFIKSSKIKNSNLKSSSGQQLSFLESFFYKHNPDKSLAFYFPEKTLLSPDCLIPALFFSHLKNFTGSLKVHFGPDNRDNQIQFYKGKIIKVILNHSPSCFGELLVEHGLSLKEDIERVFKKEQNSSKKIGEILLEKELLSPQMLNFILKEQVKIRLSEMMAIRSSFELSFTTQNLLEWDQSPEVYFNEEDFIDWLSESLKNNRAKNFLSDFYWQCQEDYLMKLQKLNYLALGQQQDFVKKYNHFFDSLQDNQSLETLNIQDSENTELNLFYFGLLTKSLYIKKSKQKAHASHKNLELFLDSYLSKSKKELIESLQGSAPFCVEAVSKRYKKIVAKIHRDKMDENTPQEIKKKAEELFIKLTSAYKTLTDKTERKDHEAEEQVSDLISILDHYEQGILAIKDGRYQEGRESLLKIKDHEQAPFDIHLYLLWGQMKTEGFSPQKNKAEIVQINKRLENFPIHLRVSYLFWFVKGLFYIQTQQYEKAKELFEKSLYIQKDFSPAKTELIFVKHKIRKNRLLNKKPGLLSYFKKSS